MKQAYIGIDPGMSGAAVVLSRERAELLITWRACQRQKRRAYAVQVRSHGEQVEHLVRRVSAIGAVVAGACARAGVLSASVAVEDAYLGRNPRTSIHVARSAGLLVGPVEQAYDVTASWVAAAEWRAAVLGLPRNTSRADAKRVSVQYLPARVPGLRALCGASGVADHMTDAAGVAEWLRIVQRRAYQTTQLGDRPR